MIPISNQCFFILDVKLIVRPPLKSIVCSNKFSYQLLIYIETVWFMLLVSLLDSLLDS